MKRPAETQLTKDDVTTTAPEQASDNNSSAQSILSNLLAVRAPTSEKAGSAGNSSLATTITPSFLCNSSSSSSSSSNSGNNSNSNSSNNSSSIFGSAFGSSASFLSTDSILKTSNPVFGSGVVFGSSGSTDFSGFSTGFKAGIGGSTNQAISDYSNNPIKLAFGSKEPVKAEESDVEGDDDDGGDDDNSIEGEEESPRIAFIPKFNFTKSSDTSSGEENEVCLYENRFKLYRWAQVMDADASAESNHKIEGIQVDSTKASSKFEWIEIGIGVLKVLKEKQVNSASSADSSGANGSSSSSAEKLKQRCRVIMRQESQGGVGIKLIFNSLLIPGVVTAKMQNATSIVLTCVNIAESDYNLSSDASANDQPHAEQSDGSSTAVKKGPQLRLYAIRSKTATDADKLYEHISRCLV